MGTLVKPDESVKASEVEHHTQLAANEMTMLESSIQQLEGRLSPVINECQREQVGSDGNPVPALSTVAANFRSLEWRASAATYRLNELIRQLAI